MTLNCNYNHKVDATCVAWKITHIPKRQQDRVKVQQHTKEQEK